MNKAVGSISSADIKQHGWNRIKRGLMPVSTRRCQAELAQPSPAKNSDKRTLTNHVTLDYPRANADGSRMAGTDKLIELF